LSTCGSRVSVRGRTDTDPSLVGRHEMHALVGLPTDHTPSRRSASTHQRRPLTDSTEPAIGAQPRREARLSLAGSCQVDARSPDDRRRRPRDSASLWEDAFVRLHRESREDAVRNGASLHARWRHRGSRFQAGTARCARLKKSRTATDIHDASLDDQGLGTHVSPLSACLCKKDHSSRDAAATADAGRPG
jgi:hypothetical protein